MSTNDEKLTSIERFYTAKDPGTLASVLSEDVTWTIPGHHPLAGTKRGRDEVLSYFVQLAMKGIQTDPIFRAADGEYAVDVHRGWSSQGVGSLDTTFALLWHFGPDGKADRVINLCADP